jgi:hypothetical protein
MASYLKKEARRLRCYNTVRKKRYDQTFNRTLISTVGVGHYTKATATCLKMPCFFPFKVRGMMIIALELNNKFPTVC